MKNVSKSILWSILEKYDNISEYRNFCDSISRFIQENYNGSDMLIIYQNLIKIDKDDRTKIDSTIGGMINTHLFSI